MTDLFLKFVNMSISATWLVFAVLILRLVMKKAPKWLNPVLWGIVGLRLMLPVTIETPWSLIPSTETISPSIMYEQEPTIYSGVSMLNSIVNPVITETFAPEPTASVNPLQIWLPVAAGIWIAGVLVILAYAIYSYVRLEKRIRTAVHLMQSPWHNIYQSENVTTPFVFGMMQPRIYLPYNLEEKNLVHVIAHEQAHIRRHDHWIKPIGFLLLALHWFNPMLWAAYILLCRDIELACDEKVIKELGTEARADYSEALLACSVSRSMISACPLAFGEVGVKKRVINVLNYKKPAFWIVLAAVATAGILAVCFLTNPIGIDVWDIINEKGYVVKSRESVEMTLSIPKDKLPDSIYTGEGYEFEENEIVVYQTDTTSIYLKQVLPYSGQVRPTAESKLLVFVFGCVYHFPEKGEILVPYSSGEDGFTDELHLKSKTLMDDITSYPDALGIQGYSGTQVFAFYISKEACRAATGTMKIEVLCPQITYAKEGTDKDIEELMLEELPSDYTLEQAKADGCVVYEDGDITHGQEIWDAFVKKTESGKEAKVRLGWYHTLGDPSNYDAEYYESIKDDYPVLYIQDLVFDGKEYTIRWYEENKEIVRTYQYLMRYEGEAESPTATYDSYVRYVLTNDNTVTWQDIWRGMISSVLNNYNIEHKQVYNDYIR